MAANPSHTRLSFYYVFSFLLLTLLVLELHEIAHITTGFFICGCWGTRDFNVWKLCLGCDQNHSISWLATLAGPLFSYLIIWFGKWLLGSKKLGYQSFGFSLIFAAIPFGRISEVLKGAGDEMVVTRYLLHDYCSEICK